MMRNSRTHGDGENDTSTTTLTQSPPTVITTESNECEHEQNTNND